MFKGGKKSRDTVHTKLLRELSHLKRVAGISLDFGFFLNLILAVLANVVWHLSSCRYFLWLLVRKIAQQVFQLGFRMKRLFFKHQQILVVFWWTGYTVRKMAVFR